MLQHYNGISVISTHNMSIHYMMNSVKWFSRVIVEVTPDKNGLIIHGQIHDEKKNLQVQIIELGLAGEGINAKAIETKLEKPKWPEYKCHEKDD